MITNKRIFAKEVEGDARPTPGPFGMFEAVVKLAKQDAISPPTDAYSKDYYDEIYCPKKFLKEWRNGFLSTLNKTGYRECCIN